MNICLVGAKGTGKSTIGKLLSIDIKKRFFETDLLLEKIYYYETRFKLSYQEIYKKIGESNFRKYEEEAVKLVKDFDHCVISTGGKTLFNENSKEILTKNSIIIYLYCDIVELWHRVTNKEILVGSNIPYLSETQSIDLFSENYMIFDKYVQEYNKVIKPLADLKIKTNAFSKEQIIGIIKHFMEEN